MNVKLLWMSFLVVLFTVHIAEAQQTQFVTVPIDPIANWNIDWVDSPPNGNVTFGGIPFAISRAFAMQGNGSGSRPTEATISGLSIQNAVAVYILPSGGWLYDSYTGSEIGEIVFCFTDSSRWTFDLIAGVHLREIWDSTVAGIRTTASSPNWQNVYVNTFPGNRSRQGYIDMLRIELPIDAAVKTLNSITFRDTSRELGLSIDPAWHLAGATVQVSQAPIVVIPFDHPDGTYHIDLQLNLGTYVIVNADELVIRELSRVQGIVDGLTITEKFAYLIRYLSVNSGGVEELRRLVQQVACSAYGEAQCEDRLLLLIGNHVIDPSGVGNIAYGYFIDRYFSVFNFARYIGADVAQRFNQDTMSQIRTECGGIRFCYSLALLSRGDFPDDRTQIETGRILSSWVRGGVLLDIFALHLVADETGLW